MYGRNDWPDSKSFRSQPHPNSGHFAAMQVYLPVFDFCGDLKGPCAESYRATISVIFISLCSSCNLNSRDYRPKHETYIPVYKPPHTIQSIHNAIYMHRTSPIQLHHHSSTTIPTTAHREHPHSTIHGDVHPGVLHPPRRLYHHPQ